MNPISVGPEGTDIDMFHANKLFSEIQLMLASQIRFSRRSMIGRRIRSSGQRPAEDHTTSPCPSLAGRCLVQ